MTALGWIIIGWFALIVFFCRWLHVCKKRREYQEGAMRSVRERERE